MAAENLPTGAQVVSGAVSVGTSGTSMTITQGSDKAIVNWNGFSVGSGNTVNFVQPGNTSAILNRVTGNTTSTIAGSITANGQVYLINPNGIAITSTGTVDVGGGFVASTLDISNDDFLNGNYKFTGNGASGAVKNEGIITVGRGGYAALIGGTVKNDGLIAVPVGKVGLGSGEQATLDLSGDGFLQVALPTKAGAEGSGALVENSGTIKADGGTVVMTAATARNAARHAVNLSGVVEADSISGSDGEIVIGGGEGGAVSLSGKVKSTSSTGKGGKITVTGKSVSLKGATVDASGKNGGGTVKIGGDYQGKGSLQTADTVSVDADTVIRADASESGNGGSVVVWSDELTTFAGLITAQGAGTGTGGNAEVSGKAVLSYTGFTNLSGPGGFGTLLLDPYNITISSGTASNSSGTTATGYNSIINVTTLENALSGANVEISTGGADSSGSQAGNITVASDIEWSADTLLTLSAANNIYINADITATGTSAGLVLNYGGYTSGGSVTSGTDYSIASGASVTFSGASASLAINGDSYTLIHSMSELDAIDTTGLSGHYALAGDLDGLGTTYTSALAGLSSSAGFTGTFAGLGHTISNLKIENSAATGSYYGLFGYVNGGIIRDIGLIDNSMTIKNSSDLYAGGLVGWAQNANITNAYATGAVSASSSSYSSTAGGLIGYASSSTIGNVYATGAVSASYTGTMGNAYAGGLVGTTYSVKISNAYATGAVNTNSSGGNSYAGGLVGNASYSTISNAYATGAVTASSSYSASAAYAGGLVSNNNYSTISYAYATGAVSGGVSGGLVGRYVSGTISNSFWDKTTTGLSSACGDVTCTATGLTTTQARDSDNYTGWDFSTVWYQAGDMRPILRSEAATAGSGGVITISNLHQLALMGANLSASYVLATDLDASATKGTNAADIWGSTGWAPVGSSSSSAFTGTFDGNGHTISNLTIKNSAATGTYYGLFGYVSGGTIRDFGLVDNSINVSGSSTIYAGGLVAYAGIVTLTNVYATGDVTSSSSSSSSFAGGLVAYGGGGTITNAYTTGAVNSITNSSSSSNNNYAGGLVAYGGGTITNAYATGDVTSSSNSNSNDTISYVGGLVAYGGDSTITNAYATGAVIATSTSTSTYSSSRVGGLVGASGSSITNAYATGPVNASFSFSNSYAGGLVGSSSSTITASYFDTDTTGQTKGVGNNSSASGVMGLTTAQFQDADYFYNSASAAGWDFTGTWAPSSSGYYPELYALSAVVWVKEVTTSSTYGDSTATINTTAYGGTSSYVFASTGDSLTFASGTANVAPTTDSGTASEAFTTENGSKVSANGTVYRVFYYGSNTTTVNKAKLTVTAGSDSKTYDGLAYSGNGGVTYKGFVNVGDEASLIGTLSYGGTAQGAVNAGTYTISAKGLTSDNYDITYIDGTLKIDPAALTVTVKNATKTYDGEIYAGGNGVSYTGFVNNENEDVLSGTLSYSGTSQGAINTGTYTLSASGLASSNYAITYVGGKLTINPKAITVSATSTSKTYGDTASLTYKADLIGNDELSGSLASDGADISAGAGSYTITQGTLANSNYVIDFKEGTLTVDKKALTVTVGADDETYDGKAYSGGNGVSYDGFIKGENEDVLGGTLVYSGTAQGAVNAGSYIITASGLSSDNYAISYKDGTLEIYAKAILVKADDISKTYGDVADLTYSVTDVPTVVYSRVITSNAGEVAGLTYTVEGLVEGDVLSGSLSSAGNTASAGVGTYVIEKGTLANSNYIISFEGANLTVTPAKLTVTANDASKTYDGKGYAGGNGVTFSGFVNGEDASVLNGGVDYGGTAQKAVEAGTYTITVDGYGSKNYTIDYRPGTLTVGYAPVATYTPRPSNTFQASTQPTLVPVSLAQLVQYSANSSAGNDGTMTTENPQFSNAVCFLGPNFAISCSGN